MVKSIVKRSAISTEKPEDILTAEAATLAGVADTLHELVMISDDANIVGMLADVVDGVNERISDLATSLARGRRG